MKRIAYIGVLATMFMSSCTDNHILPAESRNGAEAEIAFATSVSSIVQATRADTTIVNRGETHLPSTAESKQRVGIFAAYTGQYKWSQLVDAYNDAFTDFKGGDDTKTVDDFQASSAFSTFAATPQGKAYTANEMYNEPATIEAYADGTNTLTYSPLRFWPNNELTSGDVGQHEYMTFWAYYPYNPTSSMGTYGIAITDDVQGQGMGMGRVKFTMHPDASQQNDFLISAPVTDCNRDKYPLLRTNNTPTYAPKPVQLRLYHMLAQVRFYAFVRGDDKMVYQKDGSGNDKVADSEWFDTWEVDGTIKDAYGNVFTKKGTDAVERTTQKTAFPTEFADDLTKEQFVALGLKVPDETKCVRWDRSNPEIWDVTHSRRRADITYTMQLNNIRTSATFYPNYSGGSTTIDYDEAHTLGSATINHYIMNPYWFTFRKGQRERLNDNYMFGYLEDTPVGKRFDASSATTLKAATDAASLPAYADVDGMKWDDYTYNIAENEDPLFYLKDHYPTQEKEIRGIGANASKHYNYAPGNILLVVPQKLSDDDVPHVVITAYGKTTQGEAEPIDNTAKVTINMLKMGISWESGFIYCYAFLEDLKPGDDKVRGPESITVLFNSSWYTDQW